MQWHKTKSDSQWVALFITWQDLISPIDPGTIHAIIFARLYGITTLAQVQDFAAFRAALWLECGRVFQLLEVVFIRPVIDIDFCFEVIPAFLAGLPITGMSFVEMVTAKGVAIVVAGTAVSRKGKHDIVVFVIADPVAAAFRFGQVFGLTAQPTAGLVIGWLPARS